MMFRSCATSIAEALVDAHPRLKPLTQVNSSMVLEAKYGKAYVVLLGGN
jgi:hypothetical protein